MRINLNGVAVKIPIVPVTALIFYILILILWKSGNIPSPTGIYVALETLYQSHGILGLIIATLLEGLVYLGLYFPGSSIILLSVVLSDGSVGNLTTISTIVALTLTLTALINYSIGKYLSRQQRHKHTAPVIKNTSQKGLLLSALHPNSLAFYFFNLGLQRKRINEIFFVPIIMIPYGFILSVIFYPFKTALRKAVETPNIVLVILLTWILIAFIYEYRKSLTVSSSVNSSEERTADSR